MQTSDDVEKAAVFAAVAVIQTLLCLRLLYLGIGHRRVIAAGILLWLRSWTVKSTLGPVSDVKCAEERVVAQRLRQARLRMGRIYLPHHHRRFGFHTCIDTDKYCVGQTALDACGYDLDTYWLDWSCCFALPFAWDPQGQHPRRLHGGASRVNDCDCIAPGFQSAPGSVRISCVFGFGSNTSCMFCDTYCSTNNLLLGTLRNDDAAWHGGADFDRRRWQLQSHGLWGYMGRAFQLHHHGRCSISGAGRAR